MSCPSAICTSLTNASVSAGGSAGFGAPVRRYGSACQLSGNGIDLYGPGYFSVVASMTIATTEAGPVTLQFYQDNAEVVGACATAQATAGDPVNLTVPFMFRNCGHSCNSTLTYTVSAAGEIASFPVNVIKR